MVSSKLKEFATPSMNSGQVKKNLKLSPVAEATLRYGAGAVQDFGSLLRKASDGQAEFLARPSPPQAAKCVRTTLRIVHQTMKKYQKELDRFFKKNNWKYWSPLSILARLYEECGEFARLVNHLHGDKRKKDTEKEQELEEEMGDIIYTLICFANSNKIDLDKAIKKSFKKVMRRDKDRFNLKQ